MRIQTFIFILVELGDLLTTQVFLRMAGSSEGNPLMGLFNTSQMALVKIAGVLLLVWLMESKRFTKFERWALVAVASIGVLVNPVLFLFSRV